MLTFSVINGIVLLVIYLRKLRHIINDFLEQFGGLDVDTLQELNRQLSEAYAAGQRLLILILWIMMIIAIKIRIRITI